MKTGFSPVISQNVEFQNSKRSNKTYANRNNISFSADPRLKGNPEEFVKTIRDGLKALNKEVTIIMPDRCNPSVLGENTGMGSFFSNGAKALTEFLEEIGVSKVQRDPCGNLRPCDVKKLLKSLPKEQRAALKSENKVSGIFVDAKNVLRPFDPSPYSATESANELNISLKHLTEPEYGGILSEKTFERIVDENPNKGMNKINFAYVDKQYNKAYTEAYKNFTLGLKNIDRLGDSKKAGLIELNKKFEQFKLKNAEDLDKESIFFALSKKHGDSIWQNWPDKLDKNLFAVANKEYTPKKPIKAIDNRLKAAHDKKVKTALARIEQTKKDYALDIDFFKFKQFLLNEQAVKKQQFDLKHGITSIADEKVAISDVSVWANQNLFLKKWNLGCPPDYFSKTGQAWGFKVLDPEKVFNKDGTLGPAGQFLYSKYKKIFSENKGGVRIDHIIGLVDPFVYPANKSPISSNAGRLFSSPNNPELKKYAKTTADQYAALMEKIVIPAANEVGVGKEAIICEDLGTITDPVKEVMQKLDLPGIRVTQFVNPKEADHLYRGKNVSPKDIIMAGSHDNGTLIEYAQELKEKGEIKDHAKYLVKDLVPRATRKERQAYLNKLSSDPLEFANAKFAELFASPAQKVQIFFKDLFGHEERYNLPGTTAGNNWNFLLGENFREEFFNKSLPENKGLNMPEAIKKGLIARGSKDKELIDRLDKWAQVLKEPTE